MIAQPNLLALMDAQAVMGAARAMLGHADALWALAAANVLLVAALVLGAAIGGWSAGRRRRRTLKVGVDVIAAELTEVVAFAQKSAKSEPEMWFNHMLAEIPLSACAGLLESLMRRDVDSPGEVKALYELLIALDLAESLTRAYGQTPVSNTVAATGYAAVGTHIDKAKQLSRRHFGR